MHDYVDFIRLFGFSHNEGTIHRKYTTVYYYAGGGCCFDGLCYLL